MKEIDLSVLSTAEKDKILNILLDEFMTVEEAKRFIQKTVKGVTTQKGEQISTTLQETNKPYDLSPESVQQFLQNAPEEAKIFFMSNSMSDEKKLKAMNTFRYNATTIDILDKQGNVVETMEKEDHTVVDSELKPGMIEKDEAGNTHFSFAAIEHDELVPTVAEWETLLNLMPAGDYIYGKWCKAGKQLHALLGGKLSGISSGDNTDFFSEEGSFQSRSDDGFTMSYALRSSINEGGLYSYKRTNLIPVRRRAKSAG